MRLGAPLTRNEYSSCINGASLKFIPLAEMEKAGYGDLVEAVKKGEKL